MGFYFFYTSWLAITNGTVFQTSKRVVQLLDHTAPPDRLNCLG
jgi:hypothetical protein